MEIIKTNKSNFSVSELISIATINFNRLSNIQTKIDEGFYGNDMEKHHKANRIISKLCGRILKVNPTLEQGLTALAHQARYLDKIRDETTFEDEYSSFMTPDEVESKMKKVE